MGTNWVIIAKFRNIVLAIKCDFFLYILSTSNFWILSSMFKIQGKNYIDAMLLIITEAIST